MSRLSISREKGTLHFITLTTVEWIDIFTKPIYKQIIINSLKYCQKNKGLEIYAFVIMTNHLHLIVSSLLKNISISDILRDFKKFITKGIIKELKNDNRKYISQLLKYYGKKAKQEYQMRQQGNYPEIIETEKFFLQKLEYIHNNPVKAEIVDKQEVYLYSSARNWILNDHSVIKVNTSVTN